MRLLLSSITIILFLLAPEYSLAAERTKPIKKRPPLLVTTTEVKSGSIQAAADYLGTAYFARVSDVATDVEGIVEKINYDEGDRVKKGQELVRLDSSLIDQELSEAQAAYDVNLVDLEVASRDFNRIDKLFKEGAISETLHDSHRARMLRLQKYSTQLTARLEKFRILKNKKSIRSPITGIVALMPIDPGEWVSKGGKVAVVVDDSAVEIVVEVPIDTIRNLDKKAEVTIVINKVEHKGIFSAYIPRGNIATRTFTAKFMLKDPKGVFEGLEALVSLPKGAKEYGLVVPRASVVDKYGRTVVYRVVDGSASEVQVRVIGYRGIDAIIRSDALAIGQRIVVKGSERAEDGLRLQFR